MQFSCRLRKTTARHPGQIDRWNKKSKSLRLSGNSLYEVQDSLSDVLRDPFLTDSGRPAIARKLAETSYKV